MTRRLERLRGILRLIKRAQRDIEDAKNPDPYAFFWDNTIDPPTQAGRAFVDAGFRNYGAGYAVPVGGATLYADSPEAVEQWRAERKKFTHAH